MESSEHLKKTAEFYNNEAEFVWSLTNTKFYHVGLFDSPEDDLIIAQENLINSLVSPLKLNNESVMLDAGCGVGITAQMIAKKYNCYVEGITISEIQYQKANMLINNQDCSSFVKIHCQDMHSMNFPNDWFSVAIALESLLHTNRYKALHEIHRVLRNGSMLSLCDWYTKVPLENEEIDIINNTLFASYISLPEYLMLLGQCGYINIQMVDWSNAIKPTYTHWNNLSNMNKKNVNKKFINQFRKISETLTSIALNKLGYVNIIAQVSK